jgi:hypothetical protein
MSFFAGLASGFTQAQSRRNEQALKQEQEHAKSIAEMYGRLADDDNLSPELQQQYLTMAHQAATFNPLDPKSRQGFKKLAKTNPTDLVTAAHQQRQAYAQSRMQQDPAFVDMFDPSGRVDPVRQANFNRDQRKVDIPPQFGEDYEQLAGIDKIDPQLLPLVTARIRNERPTASSRTPKAVKINGQPGFAVFNGAGWTDANTGQPIQGSVEPINFNSKLEEQGFVFAAEEHRLGRPLQEHEKAGVWNSWLGQNATAKNVTPREVYNAPTADAPYGNVTLMPSNQAIGMPSPRQVVGPDGQTSVGGQVGIGTQPIPPLNATVVAGLEGWEQAITNAKRAHATLTQRAASIRTGPLWGRIKGVQLGALGGWGTSPAEKQLAIEFNNMMSDRAFAEGGKNLTGTEYNIFLGKLPQAHDTVENAIAKINDALRYAEDRYRMKASLIPTRQRGAIPALNTPGNPAAPSEVSPTMEVVWDANGKLVLRPVSGASPPSKR